MGSAPAGMLIALTQDAATHSDINNPIAFFDVLIYIILSFVFKYKKAHFACVITRKARLLFYNFSVKRRSYPYLICSVLFCSVLFCSVLFKGSTCEHNCQALSFGFNRIFTFPSGIVTATLPNHNVKYIVNIYIIPYISQFFNKIRKITYFLCFTQMMSVLFAQCA